MTEENLARLNKLLSKQITNIESNNLLSIHEMVDLSGIIANMSNAVMALTYAMDHGGDEEGWKNGNS